MPLRGDCEGDAAEEPVVPLVPLSCCLSDSLKRPFRPWPLVPSSALSKVRTRLPSLPDSAPT